jgi:ATP-binding cassette, subfamily C, bacterial LapB
VGGVYNTADFERHKGDPYFGCLLKLTDIYNRIITPETLVAGLPIVDKMDLDIFIEALDRIRLRGELQEVGYDSIASNNIPCLIHDNDNTPYLLLNINEGAYTIFDPKTEEQKRITEDEFKNVYTGVIVTLKESLNISQEELGLNLDAEHWFFGAFWRYRAAYYKILLAALFTNLLNIVVPLYSMNVYDRVISNHATQTLVVLSVGVFIALFFDLCLRFIKGYFLDVVSKNVDKKLSHKLVEKILGLRLDKIDMSTGSLISQVRELETIRDFLSSSTIVTIVDIPFSIIFLGVIAIIGGWQFLLAALIMIALMFATNITIQNVILKYVKGAFQMGNKKSAFLIGIMMGIETIKAHSGESKIQRKWDLIASAQADIGKDMSIFSSFAMNLSAFWQNAIYVIFVIIGAVMIFENELTMGALIACTILGGRTLSPFTQAASLIMRFGQVKTAYGYLDKIMNMQTERDKGVTMISRPKIDGNIFFENVTFQYQGQAKPLFRNLSFKIEKGDKIAIIGPIGSGKTTIGKMILGFYRPTDGNIFIDGIDNRQIDTIDLRNNIGYVPQDVYLFEGDIAENLSLDHRNTDSAHIQGALQFAGLYDYVKHHPDGINMKVGEGGRFLSGGQKQAIAIARAVMHDPNILLLDEPTSMMDPKTHNIFLSNLVKFAKDRTMIITTHNQSILNIVNKVMLLENGAIKFYGTKDQFVESIKKSMDAQKNANQEPVQ